MFDQHVVIPPSVMFRALDGESVLLNLDTERYFGLDVVGTRLWETLAEAAMVRAGYVRLLDEFDVEPDLLRRDIEALLVDLAEHGLITIEAAA